MALNFRLFNCDRTFNLDKVESLIQRVAKKISREIKIEKTYFPLPRLKELSEELEKGDGSHFEYAVFVVHAHESRLSINEKNAGIGYAKVYRALQKVTGDQVLVVIGGDDNYKGREECDKSVLSRWVWLKVCSQFTEDYVNGIKSFIFSWEENHHPIHEEALEFYLDPTKKGTKFEPKPRPRPPLVKAPEKEETTEQTKLLELKRQEIQHTEAKKQLEKRQPFQDPLNLLSNQEPNSLKKEILEKEFPPENNENRKLPFSEPGNQMMNREPQEPSLQHPTDNFQSKAIANKQDQTSRVPFAQAGYVPMKRCFFKASISYGRKVKVLEHEPPDWMPDPDVLNHLLNKNRSFKKATAEIWDEGDGRVQGRVHPSEVKLCKTAEGFATDKIHSILVYSYHFEEEICKHVNNLIHHSHSGVTDLSPCQPIEPASLIEDIKRAEPDYLMFSADSEDLKDEGQVKTVMREYGAIIKDTIERYVGKGLIIMLFNDMNYTARGELVSKEAEQDVRKLTEGIVPRDRLTVLTCQDRFFTTHQEWMKQTLKSGATRSASQGAGSKQHYYKAVISGDKVTEVLERIPRDWKPDEGMMRKKLQENRDKDRKAYLEVFGDEQGLILSITVEKESKGPSYYARKCISTISNPFSSSRSSGEQSDKASYV